MLVPFFLGVGVHTEPENSSRKQIEPLMSKKIFLRERENIREEVGGAESATHGDARGVSDRKVTSKGDMRHVAVIDPATGYA